MFFWSAWYNCERFVSGPLLLPCSFLHKVPSQKNLWALTNKSQFSLVADASPGYQLYICLESLAPPLNLIRPFSNMPSQMQKLQTSWMVHWWSYICPSVWMVGLLHFSQFLSLFSEVNSSCQHQCWFSSRKDSHLLNKSSFR